MSTSKLLDRIPRVRTAIVCATFPFVMIIAFVASVFVAVCEALLAFDRHFRANLMSTYNLWRRGIKFSVALHDRERQAEVRRIRKNDPWRYHTQRGTK